MLLTNVTELMYFNFLLRRMCAPIMSLLDIIQCTHLKQCHLSSLLHLYCSLSLQLIPSVHDQTHIYIGLIVGVCLGVFFIICCCLLCGCICCWERRRRRTYQKRIGECSQPHKGGSVLCRYGGSGRDHSRCTVCTPFNVVCVQVQYIRT